MLLQNFTTTVLGKTKIQKFLKFVVLSISKENIHRLRILNSVFFALISTALGIGIPNVYKMSTIKCFYFLYTSSKFFSIAGAMQKNFSSSKETKTHFLYTHFTHVRDRTACLNSFCVVALMQHKRVSSDSPTFTALKVV